MKKLLAACLLIVGCAGPLAPGAKAPVKIRAVVTDTTGEAIPVADTEIKILPYNLEASRKKAIETNQPGERPKLAVPSTKESLDAFNKAYESWERKAYAGIDRIQRDLSGGRGAVIVHTDKNGEATTELETGKWYAQAEFKEMWWEDLPVDVGSFGATITLDNSNSMSFAKLTEMLPPKK